VLADRSFLRGRKQSANDPRRTHGQGGEQLGPLYHRVANGAKTRWKIAAGQHICESSAPRGPRREGVYVAGTSTTTRRPLIWPSTRSLVAPGPNHTPLTLTCPEEPATTRATFASIVLVSKS
jgi:hypothetical protein